MNSHFFNCGTGRAAGRRNGVGAEEACGPEGCQGAFGRRGDDLAARGVRACGVSIDLDVKGPASGRTRAAFPRRPKWRRHLRARRPFQPRQQEARHAEPGRSARR